ncbi:c-type cytochrome biogenesis protein CcmI [Comamonas flocculans]|uniref:C-type cytochrome biogenesis protein CcmI n=1 Tax=Comamonas flocculans TaxID=2597701 RepID=A0A5B8RWB8_9BURK|nr:c-type cytochrome biogenesis protein CcmI [Comamonas flocculans]QEA12525.1 c-type cytochrome biogenesis protein CcmI [Comamonas flocculans]
MSGFVALAAVMVLAALGAVLLPLLRRSQRPLQRGEDLAVLADGLRELDAALAAGDVGAAEHERARLELQRQALQADQAAHARAQSSQQANWAVALATAVALPLLAVSVYLTVGQPGAISSKHVAVQASDAAPQAPDETTLAALRARVAADAQDASSWVLLARASMQLGHADEALAAYAKATALVDDSPDLWVEYANTLAVAHGRDLSGEPTVMVQRALKIDPNNLNALAFAGLAALQQGDAKTALQHWEHLKTLLPEGAKDAETIDQLIARARGEAPTAQSSSAPAGGAAISGSVTVDPSIADRIASTDTLFVFARAPKGPPMPLAALRVSATGWPVAFTLDDSSAMAQELRLSRFTQVNLVARVSKSGSATPQPGDIEGHVDGVAAGSSGVHIVLDRVVAH